MATILYYVALTVLLAYVANLLLHFIVYGFFAILDDYEIDSETGEEQPTYHNAYSSLSLKYFWKDILLEKVAFHPIRSFRLLWKFFFDGISRNENPRQ